MLLILVGSGRAPIRQGGFYSTLSGILRVALQGPTPIPMGLSLTDKDRMTCYEAEKEIGYGRKRFMASYEAREWLPNHPADYIHAIQGHEWFKHAFPNRVALLAVTCGRSNIRSYTTISASKPPKIVIGTCHRKSLWIAEWTCLHELSHAVTTRRDPGHGAAWRRNYVYLVREMLGHRAAGYLRDSHIRRGLASAHKPRPKPAGIVAPGRPGWEVKQMLEAPLSGAHPLYPRLPR